MKYIDPDGRDGYLIVFASGGEGGWGHAMFAVDNYKSVPMLDNNGDYITTETGMIAIEFVPDGTVTLYDLNPTQSVYPWEGFSDVGSYFREVLNIKVDNLVNTKYGNDEKLPTGVLRFDTNFSTDEWTKSRLEEFRIEGGNIYNGADRNCSTYTKVGVESSLGKKLNAEEHILGIEYTTPNKLYRTARDSKNVMGQSTVTEMKKADDRINNDFMGVSKSSNKND